MAEALISIIMIWGIFAFSYGIVKVVWRIFNDDMEEL